jgi:hypothetical protein
VQESPPLTVHAPAASDVDVQTEIEARERNLHAQETHDFGFGLVQESPPLTVHAPVASDVDVQTEIEARERNLHAQETDLTALEAEHVRSMQRLAELEAQLCERETAQARRIA